MLLIFTHQITNRIRYTFNLIFKNILGINYELSTDVELFKQFEGVKISYTHKPVGDEIFFRCGNLLFETKIKKENLNLVFPEMQNELTADIFALSFFLSTRYEEYFPFAGDKYERFSAKQSLAYKNNFLQKPLINIWAKKIREIILLRYSDFPFSLKKYLYTPTIDIDNAYSYIGKGLFRTTGGFARALVNFDADDFFRRINVLSGKEKDPYDTYDFQFAVHKKNNLHPIYFFLLGDWGKYDKNLSPAHPKMKLLIKSISQQAETGMHPSFASNRNAEKIKIEKERLEKITNTPVTKSRQHFLMLRFPHTYQNLISYGVTDDYTMGFADDIGFRAGTCTPYKFYDLDKEEETNLTIHPFAVMDATLNHYLKLSADESIEKIKNIVREIKNVNGEFISIWHNETLGNWREWKGWRNVYEKTIELSIL